VKPVLVNSSVPFDDWWCSKDSVTLDVQKVTAKFKQKIYSYSSMQSCYVSDGQDCWLSILFLIIWVEKES
jgi:hypothetical protein